MKRPTVQSPDPAARAMEQSLLEAPFFALMVGAGEMYFVADAVRLQASVLELALTVSLPLCAGALGAASSLLFLHLVGGRRRGVCLGAILQTLALGSLALSEAYGWTTPRILIAVACLYQMAGQFAGNLWSSWYGDLVPVENRGRYFARRNRRVHSATFAGLLLAGLLLQGLEPAAGEGTGRAGLGFALVFALAALCRLISTLLLLGSPEVTFRGLSSPRRTLHFFVTVRGSRALRLLLLAASLQVAVYIGSPYFTPFMLQDLQFSYLQLTFATACVVTAKFLLLPTWGHLIDEKGARRIYPLALLMVTVVPLPWIFADGLLLVAAAQAFSGASWACYEVSFFAVLLDASFKRTRPQIFVTQAVLNGSAQLFGSLLGVALFGLVGESYRGLFVATAGARLLVTLAALPLLPELASSALSTGYFVLRTIGVRPHGGVVHRPLLLDAEGDEESDE